MTFKITIGIPFFNNENTLELAIKSVISQTYSDWQLILIDDGSTDNSLEIANNFVNFDSRISLICDGINRGLVFRLNQIIDLSKTNFIARMDADDIMLPERLEKQISIFVNNPKIDIVATAAFTIDENNKPIGIRDVNDIFLKKSKDIFKKSLLIHPSILVKKDWYQLNKYNQNYVRAEDFELWCRTYSFTNFHRIKEPLLLYREGSVNVKNYVLSMKTLRMIYRNYSKGLLSNSELNIELFKSHLKGILYKIMGILGLQHILTSRRNQKLTKDQINYIENCILKLKNT